MFQSALKDLLGLGIRLEPEQARLPTAYSGDLVVIPTQIEHPVHWATCGCGDPNPLMTSEGEPLVLPMVCKLPKNRSEWVDMALEAEDRYDDIAECCPSVLALPMHLHGGNVNGEIHLARVWDAMPVGPELGDEIIDAASLVWDSLNISLLEEQGELYGSGESTRDWRDYLEIPYETWATIEDPVERQYFAERANSTMADAIEMQGEWAERDLTNEAVEDALMHLPREGQKLWRAEKGISKRSWEQMARRIPPGQRRKFLTSEGVLSPWL